MRVLKSLNQCAKLALQHESESASFPCEGFKIITLNRIFTPYEVSICHGEMLFLCPNGTLTYVVDNYGDDVPRVELFDYEIDITSEVKEEKRG